MELTKRAREPLILTYIAAVAASILMFFLTLVLILEFDYPNLERSGGVNFHPVSVAVVFSAILGAIFAVVRPSAPIRLAILSSSMFWGFFFVVFVCYLLNREFDWVPLAQGSLMLISAIGGALVSTRALPFVWRGSRT